MPPDGDTVTYKYDNSGELASVTDSASGLTTKYYYDLTGRLMKYTETGTDFSHSAAYTYDKLNNLTSQTETINGYSGTTSYTYDDDNRVSALSHDTAQRTYTYDDYGRLTQRATTDIAISTTESFTYKTNADGLPTGQVASNTITLKDQTLTYTYGYDGNGNITSIYDGSQTVTYVYDSQNQLVRENDVLTGTTVLYTYDDSGNIINRKEHLYVSEDTLGMIFSNTDFLYTVTDWGDLLTSYNGKTITYDEIGNPLSDGTWTYTWEHGRELASMTSEDTAVTYTYGADGLRLSKTVDGVTHHYVYSGGKLVEETFGNIEMQFIYDAQGYPMMVRLTRGSEQPLYYHYVVNLQGDVIRILKPNGAVCVTYQYDAWGNITRTGGPDTGLAQWNPLRYRGYIYDTETGLYYLQSRYYNPKVGRFINADGYVATGQGFVGNNMFAYCLNNPVNFVDRNGENPEAAFAWVSSMWWLCIVDATLPIGEAVYIGVAIILGIAAVGTVDDAYSAGVSIGERLTQDRKNYSIDDDDYYDDESNFAKRERVGKNKGNAPRDNRKQNKQFRAATKGLTKDQKRALHNEISGEGYSYRAITEEIEAMFWFVISFFDDDDQE